MGRPRNPDAHEQRINHDDTRYNGLNKQLYIIYII